MPNTIRVAASASLAALSALFALPLYIIAVGWLVMSLPTNQPKQDLAPIQPEYNVPITNTPAPFVNPQARDEKKFEACETQLVGWRPFRRARASSEFYPSSTNWTPAPAIEVGIGQSNCPSGTCPTPTTRPASPQKAPVIDTEKSFHEKKTGNVRCECCKKAMVGEDQKTYWTADNQPLTYLCTTCATTVPKKQREQIMESWLARVAPTLPASRKAEYLSAIE